MTRILIVDDHAIVRKGLRQILAETTDMVVADEATDGQEAIEKVLQDNFDVVILDVTMRGKSGIDALTEIRRHRPALPVLMLSIHPEEQYAVRTLKAGASGYLTKDSAPTELVAAIRKVSVGRKYVTATLAEKLAGDLAIEHDRALHEVLSDREYQIMLLFAAGRTAEEVADETYLSRKTISTYRTRILRKMRMRTNSELTRYAMANGLIDAGWGTPTAEKKTKKKAKKKSAPRKPSRRRR